MNVPYPGGSLSRTQVFNEKRFQSLRFQSQETQEEDIRSRVSYKSNKRSPGETTEFRSRKVKGGQRQDWKHQANQDDKENLLNKTLPLKFRHPTEPKTGQHLLNQWMRNEFLLLQLHSQFDSVKMHFRDSFLTIFTKAFVIFFINRSTGQQKMIVIGYNLKLLICPDIIQ